MLIEFRFNQLFSTYEYRCFWLWSLSKKKIWLGFGAFNFYNFETTPYRQDVSLNDVMINGLSHQHYHMA